MAVTSRERVEAALRLDVADHPPAGAWGHTYDAEWDPQRLADVTVKRARTLGWDFVKFQPRATCFSEAFGAQWKQAAHRLHGPKLVAPGVGKGANAWAGLHGDADAAPLAEQVDSIGRVCEELGPDVPVIQTVFSPLTVAAYIAGKEPDRVVRELKKSPELIRPALGVIADVMTVFAARSVSAGAAGVFFAISGYASADRMTEEVYRRDVLPYDLQVLEALPERAWFNVLHLCGGRIHHAIAADLPVQVISWSISNRGNPGLREIRERYRKAVMGGLRQRTTLVGGPPSAIKNEARAAIEETDGGRGLLLAPGCSVPPRASESNLKAMMAAA
ncbi:MAG TPA: uroporphyrinogen decarboxylase family protein [Candidatus Dormibacteraeota bacterium]